MVEIADCFKLVFLDGFKGFFRLYKRHYVRI